MGCFNSKTAKPAENNVPRPERQKIMTGKGNKQQGVRELKMNYYIDSSTKVLGVGAFGRVFKTKNKHDESF